MNSELTDFVMQHPMLSHHDHHCHFKAFEARRKQYDAASLLGYAGSDLVTAAGNRPIDTVSVRENVADFWPAIAATGYGRAVTLGCRALFDLDYTPANFDAVTSSLQSFLADRPAAEIYDDCVRKRANIPWVIQDFFYKPGNESLLKEVLYPDYYRFAWRMDDLFAINDAAPIRTMEAATGMAICSLDHLVQAMHADIDRFKAIGKLAAFKLGIAYARDLAVDDPPRRAAELAFSRIRKIKKRRGAAASPRETCPLADYLIHRLLERAHDEDVPVQVHTGYLAGNWGALEGTRAMHLVPLFNKYRRVRFDVFHASWPWCSEMGAIAKNYPNVYLDMCWAWAMNPAAAERALNEWLDAVPFNKIFSFGADTELPWCNIGYALQARQGIARVLENKVRKGLFSAATAREIAAAIMLENGRKFHGLPA